MQIFSVDRILGPTFGEFGQRYRTLEQEKQAETGEFSGDEQFGWWRWSTVYNEHYPATLILLIR